jgi:hypothetical protein
VRAGWWQIAELWCRSPVIGCAPQLSRLVSATHHKAEEIGGPVLRRLVLDEDDQAAHPRGDPGDLVQGLLDDLAFGMPLDGHNSMVAGDGEHRAPRDPTLLLGCICWCDHGRGQHTTL